MRRVGVVGVGVGGAGAGVVSGGVGVGANVGVGGVDIGGVGVIGVSVGAGWCFFFLVEAGGERFVYLSGPSFPGSTAPRCAAQVPTHHQPPPPRGFVFIAQKRFSRTKSLALFDLYLSLLLKAAPRKLS